MRYRSALLESGAGSGNRRATALGGAVALHLLLLLLLLMRGASPLPPRDEAPRLTTWDVPPPPPVPEPAPVEPPARLEPAPGGDPAKAAPDRARAPAVRRVVTAPTVPLVSIPVPVQPASPGAGPPTARAGPGADGSGTATGTGAGEGIGSGTGAGSGTGGARPKIATARWARRPTRRELNVGLPPALRRRRGSGKVFLLCSVQLDQRLRDCRVLLETREGSGYATAALAAVPYLRVYPPKVNGKPVDGTQVVVPIDYSLR